MFHVRVTCDVACTAKVAGTARKRGARRALRPKHLLRHEARGHRLQAGVETRLKAVLRRSGRRAVRSALAKGRAVRVVVRVHAEGGGGRSTVARRVLLRP